MMMVIILLMMMMIMIIGDVYNDDHDDDHDDHDSCGDIDSDDRIYDYIMTITQCDSSQSLTQICVCLYASIQHLSFSVGAPFFPRYQSMHPKNFG
jgi:hypothetical protein